MSPQAAVFDNSAFGAANTNKSGSLAEKRLVRVFEVKAARLQSFSVQSSGILNDASTNALRSDDKLFRRSLIYIITGRPRSLGCNGCGISQSNDKDRAARPGFVQAQLAAKMLHDLT